MNNSIGMDTRDVTCTSFKVALDRLMSDMNNIVTDESSKCEIYLVHGIPRIGKSTLAIALAHKLALKGDECTYVRLVHDMNVDSHALADNIMGQFRGKWVI